MISIDDAKTGLMTLARAASSIMGVAQYAKPLSLAEAGKLLRIEPRVVVGDDCVNYANIGALMQCLNALYSACWTTAADVLFKVDNVRTIRNLDRLNPNRDSTGFLLMGAADQRFEHYRGKGYTLSLPHDGLRVRQEKYNDPADLQKFVNLSVGRQIEVAICVQPIDGKWVEQKVTVNVRLKPTSVPDEVITSIMVGGNVPRGWQERWRAIMAGELNFVADGIFMRDIYKERLRIGVKDREGVQQAILAEAHNNKRYGLLTQAPSLADASNIIVVSSDFVAREIAPKVGGMLTSPGARKKVFDLCPAIIIAEIDREKNRTRFYVRGESDYAMVKDSEMKTFESKGPDVMELFMAMQTSSFNRF